MIEVTMLGPPDEGLEPVAWTEPDWETAKEAVHENMSSGDYDHGEATDLRTGERRYFYRSVDVIWEEGEWA